LHNKIQISEVTLVTFVANATFVLLLPVPDTVGYKKSCRGMGKARSTGQIGRTLSTTELTEDTKMTDDYLANECREFYLTRRRRADEVRERLREDQVERSSERHSNLDDMMADLRKDMVSTNGFFSSHFQASTSSGRNSHVIYNV
jgi:hypothetical protein